MAARLAHTISSGHFFFLTVCFRVTHNGLSERGITRSLGLREKKPTVRINKRGVIYGGAYKRNKKVFRNDETGRICYYITEQCNLNLWPKQNET